MGPANPHEKRTGTPPSAGEPIPAALAASPEYEVIREISRGGMGVVYLARNRRMDRLEGLKVVNQSLLAKAGALERFEREMRSAARLSHPNIVIAYSSPPLEGLLAFAMEYVDGTDLYHLVKSSGPLPVSNACYYIYQVAQGLAHAHDRNMVHRDIKPNNLMLTRDGKKQVIKILDFGLAKATSENPIDGGLTREGQMLGTPHYVAPEQSLNASKADIRADIYSLGCTLYYLLTGHPPFKDKESLFEILTAHHAVTAPLVNIVRPDVPADLAAIVAKMMAKDAAQRYQQPSEVAQALAPYFKAGVKPISSLKGAGGSSSAAAPPAEFAASETPSPKIGETSKVPIPAKAVIDAASASAPQAPVSAVSAGAESDAGDRIQTMLGLGIDSKPPSAAARPVRERPASKAAKPALLWTGVAAGLVVVMGLVIAWAGGAFNSNLPEERAALEKSSARKPQKRRESREIANARSTAASNPDERSSNNEKTGQSASIPSDVSQSAKTAAPAQLPADVVAQNDRRYRLFTNATTWHEAKKKCEEMRGRLAKVRSREENDFLVELARSANVDGLWLGATDEAKEGDWKWSDGSPLTYTNWSRIGNQPNNKGGLEHYLLLMIGANAGQWCDQPTTSIEYKKVGYVCEWDAAPATAFPALPAGAGKIDSEAPTTLAETKSGLKYRVLRKGSGWSPGPSDTVKVNYQGWLDDGTIFGSSYKRREPATFALAGVVKGWAEGMEWIGEGGMIELEVPPVLGYGDSGRLPDIPPNATLHYLVELIEVTSSGKPADAAPAKGSNDGFISLFNGKDLTGWEQHGSQKGRWYVDGQGLLTGLGTDTSNLYTKGDDFSDFHLRVEASINDGGNSGVFFRTQFGPVTPANNPRWPSGYEAQINSTGKDPSKTGSLYVGGGSMAVAVHESLVPPDKWFTLEVLADGNHIVIKVEGRVTADYIDTERRFTRGRLALQQHDPQTVVKFHKIEIKIGKPDAAATIASSTNSVAPGSASAPRDSKPADPMARDRSDHEAALKKAEEKLAARFDKEIEALRRIPAKSEDRLKLIDALKLEKATFDARKTIPWSLPMRPAALVYLRDVRVADEALNRAYEQKITARIKAKEDKKAEQLKAELARTAPPRLIGAWVSAQRDVWRCYSDGTATLSNGQGVIRTDATRTWSLDAKELVVKHTLTSDPTKTFTDRGTIAADGQTMSVLVVANGNRFTLTVDRGN